MSRGLRVDVRGRRGILDNEALQGRLAGGFHTLRLDLAGFSALHADNGSLPGSTSIMVGPYR